MITAFVIAALVVWGVFAVRAIRKGKTGGCCSGNCSSCSGCK